MSCILCNDDDDDDDGLFVNCDCPILRHCYYIDLDGRVKLRKTSQLSDRYVVLDINWIYYLVHF